MNDFENLDGDFNIGSLALIEFLPVENISSITDPVSGLQISSSDVSLTGVSAWLQMGASIDSMELAYPNEITMNGAKFNVKLSAFIPKLQLDTDENFELMKNQQFIVKATDNNGKVRLLGSVEAPLSFTFNSSTGSRTADRNGAQVSFFGESDHVPYYVV